MIVPRLSIQIVTWNSADVIDACLGSIVMQASPAVEVIVVDNASCDGSAELASSWFARGLRGTLLRERTNTGFCAAQNRAFEASAGEWVLFLNPDATLSPGFVATALRVVDGMPREVGTVAPCILRPDGRVDSTGLVLDRFWRLYDRGTGEASASRYGVDEDVLGCTGAVALHRRAMLVDIALDGKPLDDLLFAYYDDLDVSWRARLRGWRCRYVASLLACHRRGARNALRPVPGRLARGSEQALTVRNRLLMIAKCERVGALLVSLPWLLPFELARAAYLAFRAPAALRGYAQAAIALPAALRARKRILRSALREGGIGASAHREVRDPLAPGR